MSEEFALPTQHEFCRQPKVSVIVPVYKVEKYLVQCLNSIVNQTMEELEIIIVDEGDQDRCREIIDSFAERDPRIVAPHEKHGGYGASCNFGIRMARGEYLAIVESDDFIEPEMYEEMYAYAKALDADVVKTPFYEYGDEIGRRDCSFRRMLSERLPKGICFSVKEYGDLLGVHPSLWSALYNMSYIRENGIQFPEAKGAAYVDQMFRVQYLIQAKSIAWLDKPYYNYRIDSEGSSNDNFKCTPMLERWKEIHSYFETMKEDYDKYYAPYLILEEYYTTFGATFDHDYTTTEWEILKKNLSQTPEEAIKKSNVLDHGKKIHLLAFKKNTEHTIEILRREKHQKDLEQYGHLPLDDRFCFPWADVSHQERVIIYGGGIVGKTFLRQALITQFCHIVAVCDRVPESVGINPNRWGVKRVPVISIKELASLDASRYDKILIAMERKNLVPNIKESLEREGIPSSKIFWSDPIAKNNFLQTNE